MLAGKFLFTLIQFIDPPKPVKIPIPEIPGSLLDIDPELNTNFSGKFFISRGCDLGNVPKTR